MQLKPVLRHTLNYYYLDIHEHAKESINVHYNNTLCGMGHCSLLLVSQSKVGERHTSTLLHLIHTNITEYLPKF